MPPDLCETGLVNDMVNKLIGFFAALLTLVVSAGPASAQAYRVGPTTVAIPSPSRGSAAAFGNGVYLVVSAMGMVNGRFVAADGTPLGAPFVIQTTTNYGAFPRVAYSADADSGFGAFLVTWGESSTIDQVHARLVSYVKGGPLGADVILPSVDSWYAPFSESGRAVAYATTSREFLVVWENKLRQLVGVRVNNAAQVSGTISIPNHDAGERDPSVAYNPDDDQFLIIYTGWGDGAYAAARRVQAGTGYVIDQTKILLARNGGTYITEVAYNRATHQYLGAWYALPDDVVYGRLINRDGTLGGGVTTLSTRWKAYDALGIAYSSLSGTSFAVSHSSTAEDGGVEIKSDGFPVDNGFLVTAAGGSGNFYPKIAASTTTPDFLMATANSFTTAMVQLVHTATTGGGGGTSPPPPPPPPACTYSLDSAGTSVAAPGGIGYVTLRASAPSCTWNASSSAGWLGIGPASGTGTSTLTFSVAANLAITDRTGSLNIAGQTFTITQKGLSAAVHDINGDGLSDLMWQNQATGDLVAWYLNGATVAGWSYLSSRITDPNWKVVGTGDLNGDGYADLVWQHSSGYLACWLLRGRDVIASGNLSINPVADPNWKIRAVTDANGDGKADLIWQHDISGALVVWFMNGSTVASWSYLSIASFTDPNWKIAGGGDLNGDGKGDIVWRNQVTGEIVAWTLNGAIVTGTGYLSIGAVSDMAWKLRGVGDVNGDGRADLIWQNSSTGGLVVWFMNGYQVLSWSYLSIPYVTDPNWLVVGPG